jgi:formate-dependent nitrite reductase membrane component NrfD
MRHGVGWTHGDVDAMPATYDGTTYYDRPVVKPTHYGWRIATYFFVGGVAGAATLLAALADRRDGRHRALVRAARYVALPCAVAGPALLVADLHTPSRWYNMFRIFRRTSPMSIGSWILAALGGVTMLGAAAELERDRAATLRLSRLARWLRGPAAAVGALTSVYTGALVASTSEPLWAAAPRLIPALFGASALGTAAAALTLVTKSPRRHGDAAALDRIGLAASIAELGLSVALSRRWQTAGVADALERPLLATAYRGGAQGLGIALPLALHASGAAARSRWASVLATLATLAGGLALRATLVFGGNASARRPRDYFQFTQSGDGHVAPR